MKTPRLLAHLGVLGIIIGGCTPPDNADTGGPKHGSGGASATGGTPATSGGANGTGGVTGTGGDSGTGGLEGTGGQTGSGGAVGSGGAGSGGRGGGGMPPATGGAGGGSVSGTSAGCTAGIGFCDDFESYAEGTSPGAAAAGRWMAVRMGQGTTIAVDSMQAYSGSKALHITGLNLAGGRGATVVISTKPGDPAFAGSPTTGYVRFMMFLKTYTQTQGGMNHNRMVRIGDDTIDSLTNPQGYAIDLHYHQPAHFKLEQFNDVYYTDSDPMPLLGKWVCWEYQVGPDKTAHVWMNGTEVKGTLPAKWATQTVKFSKMTIGFESYTALPAVELWYDDVAFDATKRVGCPAAK